MNQKRLSTASSRTAPTPNSRTTPTPSSRATPTPSSHNIKSPRRSLAATSSAPSTIESDTPSTRHILATQGNHESIVFVWLDLQVPSTINLVGPLRSINDCVRAYNNPSSCFEAIQSSTEKIFFITSSSNTDVIAKAHDFPAVEAIFVLDPNEENVKGNFPKLFGVFVQQEGLFRVLKESFDVFEQVQLEVFSFEQEKMFLWSQSWKEELTHRKAASSKRELVEVARSYYRDNTRIIEIIDELDKSYRSAEALSWYLRSPFPSRFLNHALRSHNKEQLSLCRFLLADASRSFQQQPKRKSSEQVYRGMKLSGELVDRFDAHVGKLVCTSGFFPCTKSRTNAMSLALLSTYRPDLLSVLFKIDCDSSSLFIEILNRLSSSLVVFDVCMAFRVMYVKRDQMTVIKLKTAGEDGKQIAREYLEKHKDEPIQSLLDELLKPPKPPTPPPKAPTPPPIHRTPTPPPPEPTRARIKSPVITADELAAREHVDRGEVDLALVAYRRVHPVSARILNIMGRLSSDQRGDYDYAFECHTQAFKIQEQDNEDVSETLTDLGNVHHNRRELDLALACHRRALKLREAANPPDPSSIATSLVGISNAHWARQEFPEAIDNAERALGLREALVPANETSVAATLAMLGNIRQDSGKHVQALELCMRALAILERTMRPDSPVLAELLHNLGVIHLDLRARDKAQQYFERVVSIYQQILPRGHPDRVSAENDLQRVIQLSQKKRHSRKGQS